MPDQNKDKNNFQRRDSNLRKNGRERRTNNGEYTPSRKSTTLFNFISHALPESVLKTEDASEDKKEQEQIHTDNDENVQPQQKDESKNFDENGNSNNIAPPTKQNNENTDNNNKFENNNRHGRNKRRNNNYNNFQSKNYQYQMYSSLPYNGLPYYPPIVYPPPLYVCPPAGVEVGRVVLVPNLDGSFYRGRIIDINPYESVAVVEYIPDGTICNVSYDMIQLINATA